MQKQQPPTTLHGGCLCGAVRYEVTGPLGRTGHCHCSICRRSHGAAFATWAGVEPQHFRWAAGEAFVEGYASSAARLRYFCRQCGSPLASTYDGKVDGVVLASVDGDPGVRPSEHVFVGSRAPWDEIADALPQFEAWPPGLEP